MRLRFFKPLDQFQYKDQHITVPSIRLCKTDEVSDGEVRKVETEGLVLAVYNVGGEFFVTDDACTHGPGSLSEGFLECDVIECNFHQGKFNVRTGAVVLPPCTIPIKTYKASVEDGNVQIEV
jgi:nitrite reductase/ring-hydroxylating ferredoxin subunit